MNAKVSAVGLDRAREMEVFATVASEGSFSAAGRALDLTPSAVSRTIDRIEARLGVRLMLRTTRVLTLTAEGQTYLGAARRILADLNEAEQVIADQGAPRGRVRVSAALAHGRQHVVPLIGDFVRLYPHILLDINLTDAVVDVAGGQADVAIRFGPLADSPLTARRLGETGRTIVASPDYLARRGTPQVPEDLHDHDCLNFNFRRAEPVWPFRRDGRDYALTVKGPVEANNGETLTQLALAGVGVTRVGHFSVGDAISDGRLVPLLEAFNPGDREAIHAVFVGGANMPARVRVFVDFMADRLR
ncbi:LysR family transcriptional regulator [uncultured Brevundimonas sp.]|uniref:LysR family transcriptional regulator n=1 Tax=uncultured Brevundimonas sp. TaxID=213418 RepID=UPI002615F520|nr:LysR family transcriptional regulator [uncultured Brevundimonas sp.]